MLLGARRAEEQHCWAVLSMADGRLHRGEQEEEEAAQALSQQPPPPARGDTGLS